MNSIVDKRLPPVKQPEVTNLRSFVLILLIILLNKGLSWLGFPGVITFPLTIIGALIFLPYFRLYRFKKKTEEVDPSGITSSVFQL